MRTFVLWLLTVVVFTSAGLSCLAQGFDDLRGAQTVKLNPSLQSLLDKNDAIGLKKLLGSKYGIRNDGSRIGKNDKGVSLVVPFFYDVIDRTLNGSVSMDVCRTAFDAGCDIYAVFNGKTPIYLVMDYLAKTPSEQSERGMEVLELFFSQDSFDINRRYRTLPPPFSYLLSTNFNYLGGRYDVNYLSTDLVRKMIDNGAQLNTYDESGASLLLLASSKDDKSLKNYLLNNGVNINKTAATDGHNAIYSAIRSSDIDMLSRIVKNYQIRLNATDVKEQLDSVSPAMYNFLASECSTNASSYEELKTFRMYFADKKELVQSKYEDIARGETNASSNFYQIYEVIRRFPDLRMITEPKLLEIYRQSASSVNDYYRKALAAAEYNDINFELHSQNSEVLRTFIYNYSNNVHFDPDGAVSKAVSILEFASVCKGLTLYVSRYYNNTGLYDRPFDFSWREAARDTSTIGTAIRVVSRRRNDNQCGFRPFYENNYSQLKTKKTELFSAINKSKDFVSRENEQASRIARDLEIDESHTFPPSGDLKYFSGWFKQYYSYSNSGRVTLTNGDYFLYNAVYDDEKVFKWYSIDTYTAQTVVKLSLEAVEFESYDEMVSELVRASVKKHHNYSY